MNRFNKIIKYLGIIIILNILFRGFLYKTSVNCLKIKTRPNIKQTDKKLIEEINEQAENKTLSI